MGWLILRKNHRDDVMNMQQIKKWTKIWKRVDIIVYAWIIPLFVGFEIGAICSNTWRIYIYCAVLTFGCFYVNIVVKPWFQDRDNLS